MPDTRLTKDMSRLERTLKGFEYTIRSRTFSLGEVPVRVNWKGEPIKETPRGAKKWVYQLFDISKARKAESDPVSNEIWSLYEETEDLTKAVGTPLYATTRRLNVPNLTSKKVKRAIRQNELNYRWMEDEEFKKERIYLNTDQINRLMRASGKERYRELEALMNTSEYKEMDSEIRVEAMNEVNENYNSAVEMIKGEFRDHTALLFEIIQEKYDGERQED